MVRFPKLKPSMKMSSITAAGLGLAKDGKTTSRRLRSLMASVLPCQPVLPPVDLSRRKRRHTALAPDFQLIITVNNSS